MENYNPKIDINIKELVKLPKMPWDKKKEIKKRNHINVYGIPLKRIGPKTDTLHQYNPNGMKPIYNQNVQKLYRKRGFLYPTSCH